MADAIRPNSGRLGLRAMLLLGAVTALLMLGVTGSTPLTAKADAACSGGALCSFTGSHFGSFFNNYSCNVFLGYSIHETWSAKNNCGNNVRMGWNESGFVNWKFCMSPGGERSTPGRLNYVGSC
jgi:hypothetical protein